MYVMTKNIFSLIEAQKPTYAVYREDFEMMSSGKRFSHNL